MKSLSTSSVQTFEPLQAMLLIEMIVILCSGLKSESLTAFGTVQIENFDLVGIRIEVFFITIVTITFIGRASSWSFVTLSTLVGNSLSLGAC